MWDAHARTHIDDKQPWRGVQHVQHDSSFLFLFSCSLPIHCLRPLFFSPSYYQSQLRSGVTKQSALLPPPYYGACLGRRFHREKTPKFLAWSTQIEYRIDHASPILRNETINNKKTTNFLNQHPARCLRVYMYRISLWPRK